MNKGTPVVTQRNRTEQASASYPRILRIGSRQPRCSLSVKANNEYLASTSNNYASGDFQPELDSVNTSRIHNSDSKPLCRPRYIGIYESCQDSDEGRSVSLFRESLPSRSEAIQTSPNEDTLSQNIARTKHLFSRNKDKENTDVSTFYQLPNAQNSTQRIIFSKRENAQSLGTLRSRKITDGSIETFVIRTQTTISVSKIYQRLSILQQRYAKMREKILKKRESKKFFVNQQMDEFVMMDTAREPERPRIVTMNSPRQELARIENTKNDQDPPNLKDIVTRVAQDKDLHYVTKNPYNNSDNKYYLTEVLATYRDPKSASRQHIVHSMKSLKAVKNVRKKSVVELLPKNLSLAKKEIYKGIILAYLDKKTLVFDLDETLVHCNESVDQPCDIKIPIKFANGQKTEAGINIRPYARQLLENLSSKFQIIVFTASHSCYANVVLDNLDPQNKFISHRIFREHCIMGNDNMYIKDLRVINRSLSNMVLIDNASYSFFFQLQNGIPIIPYYCGKNDYELMGLQKYLQQLLPLKDVREFNRKTFKMDQYLKFDSAQKLVEQLYVEKNQ